MSTTRYLIPAGVHQHEYEVKKSRFITRIHPVDNREQAMAALALAREEYPDARHHCWAYLLGAPSAPSSLAFNDDGEPSGTAGKPMLNVLQHKDVGNVMAIVIRYFGGIKLGAGGLVRAYSTATQQAMESLTTEICMAQSSVTIQCEYAAEPELRRFLQQYKASIVNSDFSELLTLQCDFPTDDLAELQALCEGRKQLQLLKS